MSATPARAAAENGVLPAAGRPGDRACDALAASAVALLDQCRQFVMSVPEAAYSAESVTHAGGTIGKHVRHLLDHFRALLTAERGVIDFDARERNVPMERERDAALAAIRSTAAAIAGLGERELDGHVTVSVTLTADGSALHVRSTLGRELAFATHHAVHHCAMLRAIAAEFGVECGRGFGVAPATLGHAARGGER